MTLLRHGGSRSSSGGCGSLDSPASSVASVPANPAPDYYACRWSQELQSDPDLQQRLQDEGWNAFRVFATPASGPTAFVNMGFDVCMVDLMRRGRLTGPKWLLGGSTGALRNCAMLASSLLPPAAGACLTHDLKEHFVHMVYQHGDTAETLAPMMAGLYEKALPPELVEQVLHHPTLHLCVMVTQILPPYADYPEWKLRAMFWYFLGANFLSATALGRFQRRLCFYTGPRPPPFISQEEHATLCVPLTARNIQQVLHATTCLPFLSPHCEFVEGVGRGLFLDGAFGNYHLNLPSCPGYPVLLLGDGPAVKQTIWDSYVPFRRAPRSLNQHVSLLHPTPAFVASLPTRSMPNTFDFFKEVYIKQPELRRAHWRLCFELSLQHFPEHPAALPPPLPRPAEGGGGSWRWAAPLLGRSSSSGELSAGIGAGAGAGAGAKMRRAISECSGGREGQRQAMCGEEEAGGCREAPRAAARRRGRDGGFLPAAAAIPGALLERARQGWEAVAERGKGVTAALAGLCCAVLGVPEPESPGGKRRKSQGGGRRCDGLGAPSCGGREGHEGHVVVVVVAPCAEQVPLLASPPQAGEGVLRSEDQGPHAPELGLC